MLETWEEWLVGLLRGTLRRTGSTELNKETTWNGHSHDELREIDDNNSKNNSVGLGGSGPHAAPFHSLPNLFPSVW